MKDFINIKRAMVLTAIFAGKIYGSIAVAILAPSPPTVGAPHFSAVRRVP
jgi:hypothetical protein